VAEDFATKRMKTFDSRNPHTAERG